MPGQRVLTRTPYGARSLAAHWAKLMTAAFDALYGGSVSEPIGPPTDARNTIGPDRAWTSAGAKAWATWAAPTTLTSRIRCQSAGCRFQNGNPYFPEPIATAKTM